MELAIPLIALGGMYVISKKKEGFNNNNNSKLEQELTTYPTQKPATASSNAMYYPNANAATSTYLNQNAYEQNPKGNNISKIYTLSGDYVDTSSFTHQNMVPYNGSKPRGQLYNTAVAESVLDTYSGSGSQYIRKTEQAPLFKPQEHVQWTYGAPNVSDFVQSRQTPATKNNMVKPFESIHVGPGLDQGYGSSGNLGYNSGMEARDKWMPKNVDELRVATNPKQEYDLNGLQGPAQSVIKNTGLEGKMEKYRPDTFYINTQDRWLTTTGAEKAGQAVPEFIVKPPTRNETATYQQGAATSVIKTASYAPSSFEDSKRTQLEGFQAGHSTATNTAPLHTTHQENWHRSHNNYHNNRSTSAQPQTFGSGFSRAVGAVIAPLMDILKPSRKEEYGENYRVYGNMTGNVVSYVVNEGDVPNQTIKETTLYAPRGYINGVQDNGGYQVAEHQPITNQRDSTNHAQFMGASSKLGERQYDAVYRQTNNESKEKTIVGRTAVGNTNQFNATCNMTSARFDSDRENNRMWVPHSVVATGPALQTHGILEHMPQQYTESNQSSGRLDPALLNAFKENPFTHSLHSVA